MTDIDAKEVNSAVEKLTERTRRKELVWAIDPDVTRMRDRVIGYAYTTDFENKQVAVYEYEYRYYTDVDEYTMTSDVAVELVDNAGKLLWRFPEVPARSELLDAVRFQTGGAEDLVKKLLGQ